MKYDDWLFDVRLELQLLRLDKEDEQRFKAWFDNGYSVKLAVEKYIQLRGVKP